MGEESYREQSLSSWETSTEGWTRWSTWLADASRAVTDWLVERVAPQPGTDGARARRGNRRDGVRGGPAARPGGTADHEPQMVEAARRRADELGVANAEFRVIDAERIELPDGSVDAVLCRYGYMLMADPARALRETHRVLRPGGRLALAVFTEPERNPWGLFGRVLVERAAMPAPHPGAPGIFALADRARVAEPVAGAGFAAPEIEEIEPVAPFREAGGRLVFPASALNAAASRSVHVP